MKRYKYIGTEEQLVAHGFVVWNGYSRYATKNKGHIDSLHIPLNEECWLDNVGVVRFDIVKRDESGEDITPYIQDLIDDGLVEVVE